MSEGNQHFRLDGQAALVTGGGSGIGLAIAKALAGAGAKVAVVGRRLEPLQASADAIRGHAIAGDVTDLPTLPKLVERVQERVGPLSILVNNAGTHHKAPALETSDEAFGRVLDTHLHGAFALAREAARGMLERSTGSIVFVGSMAAVMGVPNVSAYTAAKGAALALVPALAAEWSNRGVRVNAVTPGWIETDMSRKAFEGDPQRKAKVLGRTPLGRMGQPEDVANAVVYLCSPAAVFVNGTNLFIDGGAGRAF